MRLPALIGLRKSADPPKCKSRESEYYAGF